MRRNLEVVCRVWLREQVLLPKVWSRGWFSDSLHSRSVAFGLVFRGFAAAAGR